MTGKQKAACLALLILSVTGGRITYSYIQTIHDIELKKYDNERLIILMDAMTKTDHSNNISRTADLPVTSLIDEKPANTYSNFVQPATNADDIMIINATGNKVRFSQNGVQQFITEPSQLSAHNDHSIPVKIECIHRSKHKLIVKCHEIGSENNFLSYVYLRFVKPDEVSLLFDAFKKGSVINVQGNFKRRGGAIEQGNITGVTE